MDFKISDNFTAVAKIFDFVGELKMLKYKPSSGDILFKCLDKIKNYSDTIFMLGHAAEFGYQKFNDFNPNVKSENIHKINEKHLY